MSSAPKSPRAFLSYWKNLDPLQPDLSTLPVLSVLPYGVGLWLLVGLKEPIFAFAIFVSLIYLALPLISSRFGEGKKAIPITLVFGLIFCLDSLFGPKTPVAFMLAYLLPMFLTIHIAKKFSIVPIIVLVIVTTVSLTQVDPSQFSFLASLPIALSVLYFVFHLVKLSQSHAQIHGQNLYAFKKPN